LLRAASCGGCLPSSVEEVCHAAARLHGDLHGRAVAPTRVLAPPAGGLGRGAGRSVGRPGGRQPHLPAERRCSSSELPTSSIDTAIISAEIALISGGTRCLSMP